MSGGLESFTGFLSKHSSTITTGASILGLVSTVVLAVRATPEAHDILEEAKYELEDCRSESKAKRIKKEALKDMAKLYSPAIITGGLTIASIVATHKLSFTAGEHATLGAAQIMVNQAIMDYREEVRRDIGDRRENEIFGRVLEKECERKENPTIIVTPASGETYLMQDSVTGVKFRSNIEALERALLSMNNKLLNEDEITVSDLYSELGIPYASAHEKLYWNIKDGYIDKYFTPDQDEETGAPKIIIHYYVEPKAKER